MDAQDANGHEQEGELGGRGEEEEEEKDASWLQSKRSVLGGVKHWRSPKFAQSMNTKQEGWEGSDSLVAKPVRRRSLQPLLSSEYQDLTQMKANDSEMLEISDRLPVHRRGSMEDSIESVSNASDEDCQNPLRNLGESSLPVQADPEPEYEVGTLVCCRALRSLFLL